jgi:hypothetical protein
MSAKLFSTEEFIHLFPSFFAIILCIISKFDHYWIDAKVQNETGRGATPTAALIASAKQIANGTAALNIHFINVLLFFAGAILAVFDWPPCQMVWPLAMCVVLFAFIFYDVLVTALCTPLELFDRKPIEQNTSRCGLWRWLRNLPPSARLRWEQIAFNLIIIVLVVIGVVIGGAEDARGVCKAENPPARTSGTLPPPAAPNPSPGRSHSVAPSPDPHPQPN